MTGLVLFLLGAVAAIFTAAQLQQQGYGWADQICFTAYNLCNQPFSLGLTAGGPVFSDLECPVRARSREMSVLRHINLGDSRFSTLRASRPLSICLIAAFDCRYPKHVAHYFEHHSVVTNTKTVFI